MELLQPSELLLSLSLQMHHQIWAGVGSILLKSLKLALFMPTEHHIRVRYLRPKIIMNIYHIYKVKEQ